MSKIGSELDSFSDEFHDFFGDDIEVTNYEAVEQNTSSDEYVNPNSEKQATSSSPISTTGQFETPSRPDAEFTPWGKDVEIDGEFLIDDDVTISDGTVDGLRFESEIHALSTDRVYSVTALIDEGNGLLRCGVERIEDGA